MYHRCIWTRWGRPLWKKGQKQGVPIKIPTPVPNTYLQTSLSPYHYYKNQPTTPFIHPFFHSPLAQLLVQATQLHLSIPPITTSTTMQLFASSTFWHSDFVLLLIPVLLLLGLVLQWRHPKHKRLPPGSMGWPYIGETLKLYTENPNSFFSTRQKRYTQLISQEPHVVFGILLIVASFSLFSFSPNKFLNWLYHIHQRLQSIYRIFPYNMCIYTYITIYLYKR